MTPAELDDWMVDYVERKGVVMGWDWEADLAFAKVTEVNPDTIKMMKSAVEGQGPVTYIAYKSPLWQAVKRARLRLMKRLTDLGTPSRASDRCRERNVGRRSCGLRGQRLAGPARRAEGRAR